MCAFPHSIVWPLENSVLPVNIKPYRFEKACSLLCYVNVSAQDVFFMPNRSSFSECYHPHAAASRQH